MFVFLYGKKYLQRLDKFIYENNEIIFKNEINNFINQVSALDFKNIYNLSYNNNNEIVGASFDTSLINQYLQKYIVDFKNNTNKNMFSKYIGKHYKQVLIDKNIYLILPMGSLSDNPFIYNFGPNIFLSYNYINTYIFNLEFDAKNYGYNNTLVNIYLNVEVEQKIFKPIISNVSKSSYRFLLSSQLVYGRVSNFLTSGINMQSDNL